MLRLLPVKVIVKSMELLWPETEGWKYYLVIKDEFYLFESTPNSRRNLIRIESY